MVCEDKHMGSRLVAVVCAGDDVAPRRFGTEGPGRCYTRTGRPFFADAATETALLVRLRSALAASRLWDELGSD